MYDYTPLPHPPSTTIEAMDAWTKTSMVYVSRHADMLEADVLRHFDSMARAQAYAQEVTAWLSTRGVERNILVATGARGQAEGTFTVCSRPVSTSTLLNLRTTPAKHPCAGMTVRAVLAGFGVAGLRGLPLAHPSGRTVFVTNKAMGEMAALTRMAPSHAWRLQDLEVAADAWQPAGERLGVDELRTDVSDEPLWRQGGPGPAPGARGSVLPGCSHGRGLNCAQGYPRTAAGNDEWVETARHYARQRAAG